MKITPEMVRIDSPEVFMFNASRWIVDRDVLFMNNAERGQYIQLLSYCWLDTNCAIPDDSRAISLLLADRDGLHECAISVRERFVNHPYLDGHLTNRRLLDERIRAVERIAQKSKAGKAGARKRWRAAPDKAKSPSNSCVDGRPIGLPLAHGMAGDKTLPMRNDSYQDQDQDQDQEGLKDIVHGVGKVPMVSESTRVEWFEIAWRNYPHRVGKKAALRHFLATVKTRLDRSGLTMAMGNYMAYVEKKRATSQPDLSWQNGSTWFNNWQDWVDSAIVKNAEPAPDVRKQTKKESQYDVIKNFVAKHEGQDDDVKRIR